MEIGFRVKRNKNYVRTTYSVANQYSNLIKGLIINQPSQVWQSDITYIRLGERFYYAVFIIDVYTKKIVGYHISDNMRATANVEALKMALKKHPPPKIHHSDRGGQYINKDYLKVLEGYNSKISMAVTSQDNAYAERINRTIKEEYLSYWNPRNFEELKKQLIKAVKHYNQNRLHDNLGRMTPDSFEKAWKLKILKHIPEFCIYNNNE